MSENNNPLDEVFGEFSTPTRRRRRARTTTEDAPVAKPEVEAPVVAAPVVEEPRVEAPEEVVEDMPEAVIEPREEPEAVIEPEEAPAALEDTPEEPVIEAPVEEEAPAQRRRRRRNATPDDGTAKVPAGHEPEEAPVAPVEEKPAGRSFAFGKKPTEEAPREFGPRFGATSRAAAKSGDTTTVTETADTKPAPTGWGARFAGGGSTAKPAATSAPTASGSGAGWGSRFGSSKSGTASRAATASRPTTAPRASAPAKKKKSSAGGFIQGVLKFVYTAGLAAAFVASMLVFFFDFADVGVMFEGHVSYSSLTLIEYLLFSENSLVVTFFEAFAEMNDTFIYVLMLGIPSILFTVNYVKRLFGGIGAIFRWDRKVLTSNLISGLQSCFTLLVMHAIAGANSNAFDSYGDDYIAYRIGDGFVEGLAISAFVLIAAYVLSFFMDERNVMSVRNEITSVARVIAYMLMLAATLSFAGYELITMIAYALEDMEIIALAASITMLVVYVRIYKRANKGFAVNMACLLDVGHSFGDRTICDTSPKTAYMKPTLIDAGVGLGATLVAAITEMFEETAFVSDLMFIVLAIAGVCAIINKIVKK